MNILITGGAGFIGSHLNDLMTANGHRVVVIDNLATGKTENLKPGTQFHQADVLDEEAVCGIFQKERPEVVIHLAAQTSVAVSMRQPREDARTNVEGSIQVLEACRQSGVRKVLYASSAAVFGMPEYLPIDEQHPCRPLSAYGISKHTVEHYLEMYQQTYGLSFTVLRFGNVYGERQDPFGEAGVIAIFLNALQNGQELIIHGDGGQTRDFIYVRDAARAFLKALDAGDNQFINIGTGRGSSVNQLLEVMQNASGLPAAIRHTEGRPADIRDSVIDSRKASRLLDWQASYDLQAGVESMLRGQ